MRRKRFLLHGKGKIGTDIDYTFRDIAGQIADFYAVFALGDGSAAIFAYRSVRIFLIQGIPQL